jgi:hypothetical protein
MYGMNIMVSAQMNDIGIKLLVDNGVMWDELWFYGNDRVDSLGFTYDKQEVQITGAGEGDGVSSVLAGCPDIHFPGIVFCEQVALVSPQEQGFYKLFPGVDGQICGTLLRNFITEFDFDNQMITLREEENFEPGKYPCSIPMKADSTGSYHIPVSIKYGDTVIEKRLYLDLGGIYPVSLVTNEVFRLKGEEVKKHLGYGASGPIYGFESTVDYLKIGDFKLNNLEVVFTEDESGGDHTNQTIGLPLLMRFNIALDYFDNVLYLAPNNSFTETSL